MPWRKSAKRSPEVLHSVVAKFRSGYGGGDSRGIWNQRDAYGYNIGEEQFASREDWFWFNAYPALSGLNLGMDRGAPLSTYCGLADQAHDRNDPEQKHVVDEIRARYQMGLK